MQLKAMCIGFVLILTAGCGFLGRSSSPSSACIPPSHAEIAETAIIGALGEAGIPAGDGAAAICSIDARTRHGGIALPAVREFLLAHEYRLVETNSDTPVINVSVDTLAVILTPGYDDSIRRTALAGITISIPGSDGTRSVYRGTGTTEDAFASEMKQTLDGSEPYVIDRIPESRLLRRVRPFLIAVSMTFLGWMLYSYRG